VTNRPVKTKNCSQIQAPNHFPVRRRGNWRPGTGLPHRMAYRGKPTGAAMHGTPGGCFLKFFLRNKKLIQKLLYFHRSFNAIAGNPEQTGQPDFAPGTC
jgi:hypothetical protein